MRVTVPALPPEVLLNARPSDTTAQVQARCEAAHTRALQRRGVANHALTPAQLMVLPISHEAQSYLQQTAARQAWSARTVHRCLRLAQTIADLAQADAIGLAHLTQAMHYKKGEKI
jgi:magnesium chelatase family protein